MRKLLKKLTAFLLAAMFLAAMLPISSSAAGTWNNPFTDVKAGDWYYNAVKYTNYYGYISGMSKTRFGPGTTTSREMFVTILGRMVGVDAEAYKGKNQFTDVKSAWSEPYIAWAAENEIVSGVGNGKFNPQGAVTREQSATILYNYLVARGYTPTIYENALGTFDDVAKISSYAKVPMQWIVSAGIINGDGSGSVKPAGTASRAQIAQILWKFNDHVAVLDGKEPLELPEEPAQPKVELTPEQRAQLTSEQDPDEVLRQVLAGTKAKWDASLNEENAHHLLLMYIGYTPDGMYTTKHAVFNGLEYLNNTGANKFHIVACDDPDGGGRIEDGEFIPARFIDMYYTIPNKEDSAIMKAVRERVEKEFPGILFSSDAVDYCGWQGPRDYNEKWTWDENVKVIAEEEIEFLRSWQGDNPTIYWISEPTPGSFYYFY